MRSLRWISVFGLGVLLLPAQVVAQEQQPAPAPPPANTSPAQTESSSAKKKSTRHQHDFLIKGTVFTPEGLSFAGARIRIRKSGEKSFHWGSEANSRGEFAIRVIQGARYEVVVSAKGWKEQKKPVDATGSERIEDMVFHMEREGSKPS
jgi:Carboxypeptidase regulatory-like domain